MLPIILLTPRQTKMQIAKQAKQRRLALNLSRKTLSAKSGVPDSTIKRIEKAYMELAKNAALKVVPSRLNKSNINTSAKNYLL